MSKPCCEGLGPETKIFLNTIKNAPDMSTLSVAAARKMVSVAQAGEIPIPIVPAKVKDLTIPCCPKGQVGIRIVRPKSDPKILPGVVYFHGGGWVVGDKETHDRFARKISAGTGAAVVLVDYQRSPEARWPIAVEEAYAAVRYISENATAFELDASKLAVAGDSSGGNLAAVVALLAKERGGPLIRAQVLFYPVTDACFDTPSYQQFAEGYMLSRETMKWFWDQYLPDPEARKQPTASPFRASHEELRGLPPAMVITAEFDVLRDEGEAYARKLVEAGVEVEAKRYPGTIHEFANLYATAGTAAAQKAVKLAVEYLRKKFA